MATDCKECKTLRAELDSNRKEWVEKVIALKKEIKSLQKQKVIEIGIGKVVACTAYDINDPDKVEREVLILDIGREVPVGTEFDDLKGGLVYNDDERLRARIVITDSKGAYVFMGDLQKAIENARKAEEDAKA